MMLTAIALFAMASPSAVNAASATASDDMVTIYHLEGRRSLRVIWLCEELGIPYKLMFKPVDPARPDFSASREMLLKVNPLMPMWPTVVYKGNVLVESGAILQLLLARYGQGRLEPPVDSDDYAYHLQWMHFAEGTAMARAQANFYAARVAGIPLSEVPRGYKAGVAPRDLGDMLIGVVAVWDFMEDYLKKHPYFGGKDFSAADIMMHFVLGSRQFGGIASLSQYPNVDAWRKRIIQRPAYLKAVKAGIPQGVDDEGWPLGMPRPTDRMNQTASPMRAKPN